MKSYRRLLAIARQSWPTISDDTLRLLHWTQQLARQGSKITLLTPRWHSSWPRRIVCDGVEVQRLDTPPTHVLKASSYQRQLSQWIVQRIRDFDLIYCDAADTEASALLNVVNAPDAPPLVIRHGDVAPGEAVSRKALELYHRANLVLAPNLQAEQQLIAGGINRSQIVRTSQVQGASYDRSPASRRAARQILGDANHDLFARSQDLVMVCPGELNRAWRIPEFIREIAPIVEQHRSLRVWILGDGRERPTCYDLLRHEGLHRLVAMPGVFTDLQEVLQAADLCVFPAPRVGLGWLLPTCIASGVPMLVAKSTEVCRTLGEHAETLTFQPEHAGELRQRISQWLQSSDKLTDSVNSLRQYAAGMPVSRLGCDELFHWSAANA